jgi:hypothetical protein
MNGRDLQWGPRGWIRTLVGRECVEFEFDRKTPRTGTDDQTNLISFIRQR